MSFTHDKITGLKIKDEGITIANPAQSLDFAGSGVTATNSGGDVTATIAGGGGTEVRNETPTGTVDGANVTFTIANTPTAGTVAVYLNGARLKATIDYTISGATITFTYAPDTGAIITVDYIY